MKYFFSLIYAELIYSEGLQCSLNSLEEWNLTLRVKIESVLEENGSIFNL